MCWLTLCNTIAGRRRKSKSQFRTSHWFCMHSYQAVSIIFISFLFCIDVNAARLTFPPADILQTGWAPAALLVLWNYPPNSPYKPRTSCGFLCIWLLLVTNVFFFLLDVHVWLSRIFQLSRPCWIACHNKAKIHKWRHFCHQSLCLCRVPKLTLTPFVTVGGKPRGKAGNCVDHWSIEAQICQQNQYRKICNYFHSFTWPFLTC